MDAEKTLAIIQIIADIKVVNMHKEYARIHTKHQHYRRSGNVRYIRGVCPLDSTRCYVNKTSKECRHGSVTDDMCSATLKKDVEWYGNLSYQI